MATKYREPEKKVNFNGYDITNVMLYSDGVANTSMGQVAAHNNGSVVLDQEIENFLKYLKAKYN